MGVLVEIEAFFLPKKLLTAKQIFIFLIIKLVNSLFHLEYIMKLINHNKLLMKVEESNLLYLLYSK